MQNHLNVFKIPKYTVEKDIFLSYDFITKDRTLKEIQNLDKRKSYHGSDVQLKPLKIPRNLFLTLSVTILITQYLVQFWFKYLQTRIKESCISF